MRTPITKVEERSITPNYSQHRGCLSLFLPFEDGPIGDASRTKFFKKPLGAFHFRITTAVPTILFSSFTARSFGVWSTNAAVDEATKIVWINPVWIGKLNFMRSRMPKRKQSHATRNDLLSLLLSMTEKVAFHHYRCPIADHPRQLWCTVDILPR